MAATVDVQKWVESQEYPIPLDHNGKIVDFLQTDVRRENTAEERNRQRLVQTLHYEYDYEKKVLGIERPIRIGSQPVRADVLIYNSTSAQQRNEQGQIYLIGEVKDYIVPAPDGQLISYISGTSAQGGVWSNGTPTYYKKDIQTGEVTPWIGIPRAGFNWDSIGHYTKGEGGGLITPHDLKKTFRACHNALYRSGIDSEDIALDMVRVILAKVEDEASPHDYCIFHITPEEYRTQPGRTAAANRVRKLFENVKARYASVFDKNERITASDDQLAIVIYHLQPYALLEAEHDVIGTAYEVYVASHLKGERGQYFTNRLVVNMMVRMANPSDRDIILDPACGSGGFLIAAMNYVYADIRKRKRPTGSQEMLRKSVSSHLFGIDTTPKLVKVAKTNMVLSRDGHTGIGRGNSLGKFTDLPPEVNSLVGEGRPTLILTNPPFGAGHELRIKEPDILANFKLGHAWREGNNGEVIFSSELNSSQGVAPEILFVERCIDWLADGGVLGIVIARGQLDNVQAYPMRKLIADTCQILAVVNLHEDTFEPFGGSKAAVIFLRKGAQRKKDYRVFMAISNRVGQTSRGEPVFKLDNEGRTAIKNDAYTLDEDLSDIAEAFRAFQSGELQQSEYTFSISAEDLDESTLSLNPVRYLPSFNATLQKVLALAEDDRYELKTISQLGRVFNGPRFKRPYAALGVTEGPTIRKFLTGTALTQLNNENVKYLDSMRANAFNKKALDILTIHSGYILVSDSGTLGRVSYALKQHDGCVATNNLIRVIIEDEMMRGYVYQYLRSQTGQHLLLKNEYGTNQSHLEPEDVADMPIPIPKDRNVIERIGRSVLASVHALEESLDTAQRAGAGLDNVLSGDTSLGALPFESPSSKPTEYASRFEDLFTQWRSQTAGQSSPEALMLSDSYFGMIALGDAAIPFFLKKLEEKPVNVFHALRVLTGIDPVKANDQGNLKKMSAAWLTWGRKNNYIN